YKYPGTDKSVGEWDGDYWGKMSIRRALAWSRNVPAVKTFVQATQEAGKEKVMDFARNIGVPIEQFHYSAALGAGIQVSPLQMAGAYATFGNQGVHHEPYTVRKIVFPNGKTIKFDHKPEVTMHKYTAYMVTDMLKTVLNKGTGQLADIPGLPVAGKTGSTQIPDDIAEKYNIQEDGYLDEWFTGYTSQYAISVWTGYPGIDVNDDGEAEFISFDNLEENPNLDSTDLAKLIFKKLMMDISGEDVPDWEMPDNVVKVAVEEDTGLLPSENTPEDQIVKELFVEGTQPTKVSNKYKKLETPKNLEAQYDKKKKQIIVTWDYPEKQKNIGFEVSYSVDGQSMQKQGKVGKTKFIVNNPTPGSVYEFQVKAVNSETKKESDPVTTSVEIPEEEVALVPPQQLTAKYDKKTDQILLTWSYPERENTVFKINGSVNGQPLQSLGSTEQTQVVIKNPQPNSVYQFQIIAVDSETGQTGPPAETAVRIPKEKPQGPPEPPPGQDDSDGSTEPPGSTGDDTGTNTGTNTGTDTGTEDQGDENTGDDDNVSGETNDNGGNDSGTQTNDDQTNENNDGSVSGKENEDDPSSPVPGLP
ncbi:MAG TPA: penicillin-binding transpeptidase domain-containing protein, partial [Bacillales bacterium]